MREKNQATILYFTEYLLLFNLSWANAHDIEVPVKNTAHESRQWLQSMTFHSTFLTSPL